MADLQVTGITWDEIGELEKEFEESNAAEWYEFKERYCLWPIPRQPEDYDGEKRYCNKVAKGKNNGYYRCRFHEHRGRLNVENFTPGNPKHYMRATDEYLMNHLDEDERDLYQSILDWAEIYGINKEEDPAAYDDLKLLAKQRVREVKASKYLFEEGEIRDKVLRDEDGNVLMDENGEPKTEDDTNVISEEYRRLINLISSLKKDLLMTRKEQAKADDRNKVSESAAKTGELFQDMIKDDEKKFDVTDYEP